ncbi:MAG: polysaccharide biosynthesis tyrosine autokinase [Nitrospiraceae bacterium]|nr:polysaccharide biosynthesis tyrosine autokinase [Nitrospiraceae bacterium]
MDANGTKKELEAYRPQMPAVQCVPKRIEEEEETTLRDYYYIILRRKWIFLTFLVSVVVTAIIGTFMARPVYESTVTIRIDKENPNILSFNDIYRFEKNEADYYQTQYKILKSRNIARRVICNLDLGHNREFMPEGKKPLFYGSAVFPIPSIKDSIPDKKAGRMEDGIESRLINEFLGRVKINPVQKSQLVEISFDAHDPALAQRAANAIADTFIAFNIESKFQASEQARKWLEEQIDLMKAKVEASEEKLNEYAAGNGMLFIEGKDDNRQSLPNNKLAYISEALNQAVADRISKEALYKETRESGSSNAAIIGNPLIQKLKSNYADLESEYYNLLKMYKPGYPKMKRLESQMASLNKSIKSEKNRILGSIEYDYKAARKKEGELQGVFERQKRESMDFQRKTVQYQILKREVDTNKELYNSLLQRLKEIGVSATMTTTNIQVLDKAELPKSPSSPQKGRNILLALMLGLIGGAGAVLFTEYIDNTVKGMAEIERKTGFAPLGVIPLQSKPGMEKMQLLSLREQTGLLAEAFRCIGTFILFSSASTPPKKMLITSPESGDGKTTISLNTAAVLTGYMGKGIIIDADLRKSRLHRRFGVSISRGLSAMPGNAGPDNAARDTDKEKNPRKPGQHRQFDLDNAAGLSTYLSGNMGFDNLIKNTGIENLDIIMAGPTPPKPSELLGSSRMKELVEMLGEMYNFVIIDSPPVLGMADSVNLASFVDGVIVIARSGKTTKSALAESKKVFNYINARVLGVVVNGIRENDLQYRYYYPSRYYNNGE